MMKLVIIIAASIFVGLLSILFGDNLWRSLGINDAQLRVNLTAITSYFFIFSGFLFVIMTQLASMQRDIKKNISTSIPEDLKFLRSFEGLTFYPGIRGLNIVADKLTNVSKVLNTRIIPLNYTGQLYSGEATRWNQSISDGIIGGIDFVDVVSGQGVASSVGIQKTLASQTDSVIGRYDAIAVNVELESFLNFKVLTFNDGTREVWAGWRVSNTSSINEMCFRSSDTNLTKIFEDWHRDLVTSGERVAQFPSNMDEKLFKESD